jgi:hemolysin activation/secretion protein
MRRPLPALLICLLLLPLRLAMAAQTAGAPPVVASVQFTGAVNVPEETLRKAVTLQPGGDFTSARLDADRKALLALGYFRSVAAVQRTANGKTDVTFRVVEWPRVTYIRITGNTVVPMADLQKAVKTSVGDVLRAPQLQDDIAAIEDVYHSRGYVARVSEQILDEATRSGILNFDILEFHIAEVALEGGSPRFWPRCREALWEIPPAYYRPEAVADDQRRLLRVKGVDQATPRVETISPGKVRIRWLLNLPDSPKKDTPRQTGASR